MVTSFISPENNFNSATIYFTRTIYSSISNGNFPVYKDATVIISNGTDTASFYYSDAAESYLISKDQMPIERGRTYYLKVTTPGGYTAEASCTVPAAPAPDPVIYIDTIPRGGILSFQGHLRFTDNPGEGDYYRVSVAKIDYWMTGGDDWMFKRDSSLLEQDFEKGKRFVSDKGRDKEQFFYTTIYYDMPQPHVHQPLFFTLSLTDYNYYKYHLDLENFDGDNPFAEPAPIYSNIKGGLGVFAAYTQKSFVVPSLE